MRVGWVGVALAALGVGCGHSIRLEVLKPAAVSVPTEVQTLAVIDRSKAKNVGEGILGVLEGAATGEAIGADTEGRSEAMRALVETLATSPRFKVVHPSLKNKDLESSLFDKEMSWATAEKICAEAGCDGILSLEAFDSDTWDDYATEDYTETDDKGKEIHKKRHIAQRDTQVLTAWRVYALDQRSIVDDQRAHGEALSWREIGTTKDEAFAKLPSQFDTVSQVAALNGEAYARRIAPTPMWVSRSYYGNKSDALKEAMVHVRAQDWDGAETIWRTLLDDPDPKLKGKAEFNLALRYEVAGDLDRALDFAKKAAVDLHNGRSRDYVHLLTMRQLEQDKLREQLAQPEPEVDPARERENPDDGLSPSERGHQRHEEGEE